ncbi:hypothetical protein QQ008_23555 [Fulvivirgaceae bacterium BMA10]|uniref:Transglutaminase n=1 Tax=Splendidivirga corallicola TaxID=3051826 RepID=A0ABT8KW48_9BACT|nr:hypothetical protein [Fulvivirgaceae bacterium BMA10]
MSNLVEKMKGKIQINKSSIHKYYRTNVVVFSLALLSAWPLLLLVAPFLDNFQFAIISDVNVAYFLVFGLLVLVMNYVIKRIKPLAYFLTIAVFLGLSVSTIAGSYTFKDAINDYMALINRLQQQSQIVSVMSESSEPFPDALEVAELIREKDSKIRNFAVKAATKHFVNHKRYEENRELIQYFSIFKEINEKWIYVADPKDEEYFASPAETIEHLTIDGKFNGDCDDYTILIASCLKNIGGDVRMIRTPSHIYPELRMQDEHQLKKAVELIRRDLFKHDALGKSIFYHKDSAGNIWLNLDYTGKYPGGRFLSNDIIGVLEL